MVKANSIRKKRAASQDVLKKYQLYVIDGHWKGMEPTRMAKILHDMYGKIANTKKRERIENVLSKLIISSNENGNGNTSALIQQ